MTGIGNRFALSVFHTGNNKRNRRLSRFQKFKSISFLELIFLGAEDPSVFFSVNQRNNIAVSDIACAFIPLTLLGAAEIESGRIVPVRDLSDLLVQPRGKCPVLRVRQIIIDRAPVGVGHHADIVRGFCTSFDLKGGHPRLNEFVDIRKHTQILRV